MGVSLSVRRFRLYVGRCHAMPTELTTSSSSSLTPREQRAIDALGDGLIAAVRRRLPMTLQLVRLELDLARSELAVELLDEVAAEQRRQRDAREPGVPSRPRRAVSR